jgi:hypothetical protein
MSLNETRGEMADIGGRRGKMAYIAATNGLHVQLCLLMFDSYTHLRQPRYLYFHRTTQWLTPMKPP